jgi:hypothetical protein
VALINHRTREIHFKIVYYGPGLCGKTTNLKALHDRLPAERRGRMISIATDHERTLFFDFLPIDLGQVNGFTTRFHLYTVPGQVYYKLSRKAVLQGVDAIIFVADSHPAREYANRDSLADLYEHLRALGITGAVAARIPWVFQWNKRDVAHAIPAERLRAALNVHGAPEFEAVASEGRGVNETLRSACKAVLARLATSGEMQQPAWAAPGAAPTTGPAPALPAAARVPEPVAAAAPSPPLRVSPPARVAPPAATPAPPARVAPPAATPAPPVRVSPPVAAPAPPARVAPPLAPPAPPAPARRAPVPRPSAPASTAGPPAPPIVRRVVPTTPAPGAPSGPVRIVPRPSKPPRA